MEILTKKDRKTKKNYEIMEYVIIGAHFLTFNILTFFTMIEENVENTSLERTS